VAQRKQVRLGTMRFQVRSPASFSGLRIWHCCELWCRSQTQLTSGVAVAVAVVADFLIGPLAWEPPYASDVGLKTKEKKNPKNKNKKQTCSEG